VSAAGVAAGATLEVIGRGKDQIRTFEVIVLRLKRRWRLDGLGRLIHVDILSQNRGIEWNGGARGRLAEAMGRIEA
jgi:hypothetical protein